MGRARSLEKIENFLKNLPRTPPPTSGIVSLQSSFEVADGVNRPSCNVRLQRAYFPTKEFKKDDKILGSPFLAFSPFRIAMIC